VPTNLEQLATIKANYLAVLAADSLTPQVDYSIDGKSVTRSAWRKYMLDSIKELNELQAAEAPFELHSQGVS
jgi:hypothetical protein